MKKQTLWCDTCGHRLHTVNGRLPAHSTAGHKLPTAKRTVADAMKKNARERHIGRLNRRANRPDPKVCM